MTNDIHVILDNGHGNYDLTRGKCSPVLDSEVGYDEMTCFEGRFREGMFNRDIAHRLESMLKKLGVDVYNISRDDKDISLGERVRRANDICKKYGKNKCVFISIHANAAGNGERWMSARGTSVHTCNGCSKKSEQIAMNILNNAVHDGFKGNRSNGFQKNDFYVVKNTLCPAVLVENLFYDNRDDVKILMSEDGREKIATYIYMGIMNYIN